MFLVSYILSTRKKLNFVIYEVVFMYILIVIIFTQSKVVHITDLFMFGG